MMNIKVDLSSLIDNKRKFSIIFVDTESLKKVSDVILYICKLFELKCPYKDEKYYLKYSLYDGVWYIHPNQPSLVLKDIEVLRFSYNEEEKLEDPDTLMQSNSSEKEFKRKTQNVDKDIEEIVSSSQFSDHLEIESPTESKTSNDIILLSSNNVHGVKGKIVEAIESPAKESCEPLSKNTEVIENDSVERGNNISPNDLSIINLEECVSIKHTGTKRKRKRRHNRAQNKIHQEYQEKELKKNVECKYPIIKKSKYSAPFSGSHKVFDLSDDENGCIPIQTETPSFGHSNAVWCNNQESQTKWHSTPNQQQTSKSNIKIPSQKDIPEVKKSGAKPQLQNESFSESRNTLNPNESDHQEGHTKIKSSSHQVKNIEYKLSNRTLDPPLGLDQPQSPSAEDKLKFKRLLDLERGANPKYFKGKNRYEHYAKNESYVDKNYSFASESYDENNSLPLAFASRKSNTNSYYGSKLDSSFRNKTSYNSQNTIVPLQFNKPIVTAPLEDSDSNCHTSFIGAKGPKTNKVRHFQSIGNLLNSLKTVSNITEMKDQELNSVNLKKFKFGSLSNQECSSFGAVRDKNVHCNLNKTSDDVDDPISNVANTESANTEKEVSEANSCELDVNTDVLGVDNDVLKVNKDILKIDVTNNDILENSLLNTYNNTLKSNNELLQAINETLEADYVLHDNKNASETVDHLLEADKEILSTFSENMPMPELADTSRPASFNENKEAQDAKVLYEKQSAQGGMKNLKNMENTEEFPSDIPIIDLENFKTNSGIPKIKYELFPLLTTLPKKGDIIGSQVLSLDGSMCPRYSEYRPAKVISREGLSVKLCYLDETNTDFETGDENKITIMDWRDLKNPRLLFP